MIGRIGADEEESVEQEQGVFSGEHGVLFIAEIPMDLDLLRLPQPTVTHPGLGWLDTFVPNEPIHIDVDLPDIGITLDVEYDDEDEEILKYDDEIGACFMVVTIW